MSCIKNQDSKIFCQKRCVSWTKKLAEGERVKKPFPSKWITKQAGVDTLYFIK
jgi:hypothetical protein